MMVIIVIMILTVTENDTMIEIIMIKTTMQIITIKDVAY